MKDNIQMNLRGMHCEGTQNKMLRRINGPKRETTREWGKIHNEELHY
jgi:hypothetical protein